MDLARAKNEASVIKFELTSSKPQKKSLNPYLTLSAFCISLPLERGLND